MQDGSSRSWRKVAEQHHTTLVNELATAFDSQLNEAISEAVADERRQGDVRAAQASAKARDEAQERTQRTVSDGLNQTLRRIRQAPSQGGVLSLLAEASSPWAGSAVVVSVHGDELRVIASRSVELEESTHIEGSAAIGSVLETGEPVTALATPSELSEVLSEAFGSDRKCHLLPVSVRGEVAAVLIVANDVVTGALELLTEATGMRLEVLNPTVAPALKPLATPGLVQIGGAPKSETEPSTTSLKWDDLSPAEQKSHLYGQRIARVRVAEMRLYHAEALREGVFAGNIYDKLRDQIDKARTEFLQNCLSQSPSMVDYLHLEILRSLAHDDERLLGSDYPGPMV